MSILHVLCRPIASENGLTSDIWLLVLVAGSIAIAFAARVIPPRDVIGSDRLQPDRSAWLLAGALFTSLCAYLFSASLYSMLKYPPASHPGQPVPQPNYSPVDNAYFSTVPGLIGFVAMLIGDRFVQAASGRDLGIDLRRLPSGLAKGLIGVLIVLPPLFLLEQALEVIYRVIQFQHPTEHPLLHLLRERPNRLVTASIIVGACIIAPLFEELLFRGHLQTLLRRLLYRLSAPRPAFPAAGGFPVIPASPDTGTIPASNFSPPKPKAWQAWGAILITSVIFASVHPAWSQPIIFVLSVCLGYAYERTGNLWVPITIHAVFNSISTALFLSGVFSP